MSQAESEASGTATLASPARNRPPVRGGARAAPQRHAPPPLAALTAVRRHVCCPAAAGGAGCAKGRRRRARLPATPTLLSRAEPSSCHLTAPPRFAPPRHAVCVHTDSVTRSSTPQTQASYTSPGSAAASNATLVRPGLCPGGWLQPEDQASVSYRLTDRRCQGSGCETETAWGLSGPAAAAQAAVPAAAPHIGMDGI